ncbi:aldo/keto reductase [Kocuria sp. JC486]|uniref:Aldo/keto reductase n=1 Tax=Kocuria soli TaxID=2485125 RepID=A0A3N3ZND1_9MICC|nr:MULTISPECIES: aldo/keto reductase [Kocuria]NHU85570.1 aldo/keto reductase [Kocuria sp. JC486]ROZ62321.1 aldo/keto reductase [Kocuria soli]
MSTSPTLVLNDDHRIPQLGFGTWQVEPDVAEASVATALETGYRHIDTAAIYGNEEGVGRAIAASGVPREEIFLTTKLWNTDQGYDSALAAFDQSLERLGTDYVDLYLIHWPCPENGLYRDSWEAFRSLRESGRARSIGVSNFPAPLLEELVGTGTVPAVNQIELHPYFPQVELRAANASHGVLTEAWSPLGQGGEVLTDPVVTQIAEEVGATPAQTVLAWHLAIGNIVFPKSVTPDRIRENWGALDIVLDEEQLERLTGLGRENGRLGPNPMELN